MKRISRKHLLLKAETIKSLVPKDLAAVRGGNTGDPNQVDVTFLYSCATVYRSCYVESCAPSNYYVCPM